MVNIWTKFTDLERKKQRPALAMSLSGRALEAILELEDEVLPSESGEKSISTLFTEKMKISRPRKF